MYAKVKVICSVDVLLPPTEQFCLNRVWMCSCFIVA